MKRLFGKDFSYKFTPYEDGELVANIPAHTAKAFIYSAQPSRSQVLAELGALATTTQEWVAGAKTVEFDIEAIPDPDPNADTVECQYYIGFKFKVDADEDYQCVILALPMIRALGTGSNLVVSVDDCVKQYSAVTSFFSVEKIQDQIEIQKSLIRLELAGKGYDWSMLWRPDQLKMVVVCATLSALLIDESVGEGDKFDLVSRRFHKQAGDLMKLIRIEYDDSLVRGTNVRQAAVRGPILGIR